MLPNDYFPRLQVARVSGGEVHRHAPGALRRNFAPGYGRFARLRLGYDGMSLPTVEGTARLAMEMDGDFRSPRRVHHGVDQPACSLRTSGTRRQSKGSFGWRVYAVRDTGRALRSSPKRVHPLDSQACSWRTPWRPLTPELTHSANSHKCAVPKSNLPK